MSNELKLERLKTRIVILRSKGETMNMRIINKLERKVRAMSK